MKVAPILVSVYDRFNHFQMCVESLQRNPLSEQSHLFVAIDAPFKEEHKAANQKVIDYAKSIRGFKNVVLFIRDRNLGGLQNRQLARAEIFNVYDRLIMFEDDNVFSPSFLTFVNKGLEVFQDRKDIFSVSGYNFPIRIPKRYKKDVYLFTAFTAWGVGVWKNKWEQVDWSLNTFNSFVDDMRLLNEFKKSYEKAVPQLLKIKKTGKITGDGIILVHMYLKKMYSVFPVLSMVRNIGHDGTGEHCGKSKGSQVYMNQNIYEKYEFGKFPLDLEPDAAIIKVIQKANRYSISRRVKIILHNLLK